MNKLSSYSCYDQSTFKSRSAIQIYWFLNHSGRYVVDRPDLLVHPKYSDTKLNRLNFRQCKKLALKHNWVFQERL